MITVWRIINYVEARTITRYSWRLNCSPDSSVSMATIQYRQREIRSSITKFVFFDRIKTAEQSTKLSVLWASGTLLKGYVGRSVKLATHLHLVSRLRVHGALPPRLTRPPVTIPSKAWGKLYLHVSATKCIVFNNAISFMCTFAPQIVATTKICQNWKINSYLAS